MGISERYLSLWVGLCILAGVVLGNLVPQLFELVASVEYAHVNLVVALFIWIMIYPMMVQIDFSSLRDVGKRPRGLVLTLVVNWLIKPFTMAALGWLFFQGAICRSRRPRVRHRIYCGHDIARRCTLHRDGLRLESIDAG